MPNPHVTPELARAADAACVFTNLDTVTDAATGLFDRALAPAEITVEQLGYLVCIQGLAGITVADLAQRKCKETAHVRAALGNMAARDWVRAPVGDDDPLALTVLGHHKLDEGAALWGEMQSRIVEPMGGDEIWLETLDRITLLHACIMSAR